jgi:hypothetical protein
MLAGGGVLPPRPVCDTPAGVGKFLSHLAIEFRGIGQLTKDIRTGEGGPLGGRT